MYLTIVFLTLSAVGQTESPSAVPNANTLVERDWSVTTSDGTAILSLRPTDSWAKGKVWYVRTVHENDRQLKFSAWTGKYAFSFDGLSEGTLGLTLRFPRCFDGIQQPDGSMKWKVDTYYRERSAYAVQLEIPLVNGAVPENEVQLVPFHAFRIDETGRGTRMRATPDELHDHFQVGHTYVITNSADDELLPSFPPPGFVHRHELPKAQPKSMIVYDATSLIDREWTDITLGTKSSETKESDFQFQRILSLHRSARWDQGTAWLIDATEYPAKPQDNRYHAWKGTYHFYGDRLDDDDTLLLQLAFPRMYDGTPTKNGIEWGVSSQYARSNRSGVVIEIPLDARKVRQHNVTAFVSKTFFVDQDGRRETRYSSGGFLGLIQEERTARPNHLAQDETLNLTDAPLDRDAMVRRYPPPGFTARDR